MAASGWQKKKKKAPMTPRGNAMTMPDISRRIRLPALSTTNMEAEMLDIKLIKDCTKLSVPFVN